MKFKELFIGIALIGLLGVYAHSETRSVPTGNRGEINPWYGGVDWYRLSASTSIQVVDTGESSLAWIHFSSFPTGGTNIVVLDTAPNSALQTNDSGIDNGKVFKVIPSTMALSNYGGVSNTLGLTGADIGYTHVFNPPVHLKRGASFRTSSASIDATVGITKFGN